MKNLYVAFVAAFTLLTFSAVGQSEEITQITRKLAENYPELKSVDLQDLYLNSSFTSKHNGVKHMYLQQTHEGIRIKNSSINAAFSEKGELAGVNARICFNAASKADPAQHSLDLKASVSKAISGLGFQASISVNRLNENQYEVTMEGPDYFHKTKAELVYWHTPEDDLKLVWEFDIDLPDESHWYQYAVSAINGEIVEEFDLQLSCAPVDHNHGNCAHFEYREELDMTTLDGSSYRAFPLPVESPSHGVRELITEPADPMSSPFGWHDNDGFVGADFTITRGNNVYAYDDVADNNFPGFSPDGGESLDFDYPLDFSQDPEEYRSASLTNLFYANNVIHDVLYAYGFTEESGNFQDNNYGNGGFGNDYVNAEGQDGGGLNNANMATPEDGNNPRMQMYLWNAGTSAGNFVVNAPDLIQGVYQSSGASPFGPPFPSGGLTGDLVLAEDAEGADHDICSSVTNATDLEGNIAILYRGNCPFVEKVLSAQEAGAIGVVVINNLIGEPPFQMGGTSDEVEIPSLMIGLETGSAIVEALDNGDVVNITAQLTSNGVNDGSFDNGIVIHEYVHGLTNRLTGGGNNVFCLFNEEQMGEGWSDWYALMMTMDMDMDNPVYRPMGTYAVGQPIDGTGIRPVAYDTSFAVNGFTYADLPNGILTVPHGVGFVWSTMLWDLTWAFIDEYGYDPDLINGDAGNNRVLQLVTDALTLQACQPGFVDGRDAILLADELLYDGANQCMIWNVFAKRGLGFSADQGSSNSRSDGTAAFDVPAICQPVFNPPSAAFTVGEETTCSGLVSFNDESTDVPQSWLWDFGDGNTSTDQNPVHQYEEEGTYSVTLTVSNTLGEDQVSQSDLIIYDIPNDPETTPASGCAGETIQLSAASPDGYQILWMDNEENQIALGDELEVVLGSQDEVYFAQNYSELPLTQFVGPETEDFGTGGLHGTDFVGTVDFEVTEAVVIESALVISGSPGSRTIDLYSGPGASGEIIQTVVVDIDFTGSGRIDLGFVVEEPGVYSFGLNQANLYRNNSGPNYPYEEESGIFTIIVSSAGPEYYYYFYDLEVKTPGCVSEPVEVLAEVTGEAAFTFESEENTVSFFDNSPDANSWSWNFGDGNTSNEQNPVHTYAEPGTYTVTLIVNDGCSITEEINVNTLSTEEGNAEGIALYPNPASDRLFIETTGRKKVNFILLDVSGKEVLAQPIITGRHEIDVRDLSSGIYFARVLEDNQVIYRSKITIME